eukprot:TRINITY_DN14721_c0_g1_i2.p1 TRINITY_DN14721_c0_g1~~TRINITY_DN14721_c0_g1_i2.p1  ORF type:complete len:284 (+),score=46.31 TRINITY_DN14721_c0_g1_i2:74-925(+)
MTRWILVTGANKGVGLAIVRRCVLDHDDTNVVLACRSKARGDEAMLALAQENPDWRPRLTVLEMDTSKLDSVTAAAASLATQLGEQGLYAIVNNAGIAAGSIQEVLQTNVYGPHRVDLAFLHMLQEGGRIVNISSGAGPRCVQSSSAERKQFFLGAQPWEQICGVMDELEKCENTAKSLKSIGIGSMSSSGPGDAVYGVSKALLNCYTARLAQDNPQFKINSCSPGAIATDLFKDYKCACILRLLTASPDKGTKAPMYLLFAEVEGNGCFYHKSATKRAFDKY